MDEKQYASLTPQTRHFTWLVCLPLTYISLVMSLFFILLKILHKNIVVYGERLEPIYIVAGDFQLTAPSSFLVGIILLGSSVYTLIQFATARKFSWYSKGIMTIPIIAPFLGLCYVGLLLLIISAAG